MGILCDSDMPVLIEVFLIAAIVAFVVAIVWVIFQCFKQGIADVGRRRRRSSGLCVNCGYDLRESRGKCPECGTSRSGQRESERTVDHDLDVRRLSRDWPDAPIEPVAPDPAEPMVQLIASTDGWGMELLIDQLTARGVWVAAQAGERSQLGGSVVNHYTLYTVIVPQTDLESARMVLDRFRLNDDDDDASDDDDDDRYYHERCDVDADRVRSEP